MPPKLKNRAGKSLHAARPALSAPTIHDSSESEEATPSPLAPVPQDFQADPLDSDMSTGSNSDDTTESDSEESPSPPLRSGKRKRGSRSKPTTKSGKEKQAAAEPSSKRRRTGKSPPSRKVSRPRAPKKVKEPTVPTAKAVTPAMKEDAKAANPEGVHIIAKDMVNNSSAMAGYLKFATTKELRLMAESETIRKIMLPFYNCRAKGFGVPEISANYQMQTKTLFRFFTKEADEFSRLRRITTFDPDDPVFDGWKKDDKPFITALYAGVIHLILRRHRDMFSASFEKPITTPGVRYLHYLAEDVFRVYTFIRWWLHWKGRHAPTIKDQPALPPSFLTEEETADLTSRPEAVSDYCHPVELLDQGGNWIDEDVGSDDEAINIAVNAHDETALETMVSELAETGSMAESYMDKFPANVSLVGVRVERPPLSERHISAFLQAQSGPKRLRILHDEFVDVTTSEARKDEMEHTMATAGAVVELEADPSFNAISARKEFWSLRSKLSTVSASAPDFVTSLALLRFPTKAEDQESLRVSSANGKHHSKLKPNAWQTTGAAFMMRQESTPMGGGILADDCGLGKTITTLLFIAKQAEWLEAEHERGNQGDYRPTLVVCPSSVVDVWYNDWSTWFRNILYFHQYFGSSKTESASSHQQLILPQKAREARAFIEKTYPRTDPKSARCVIVTAYETFALRTLAITDKAAEDKDRQFVRQDRTKVVFEPNDSNTANEVSPDQHIVNRAEDPNDPVWTTSAHQADLAREKAIVYHANDSADAYTGIDEQAKVYASHFKHLFARVICDEGHKLKSTKTTLHRSVFTLYTPYKWIVSATPMINRAVDLLGYLNFFWNPDWRGDDDMALPKQVEDIYDDEYANEHTVEYMDRYGAPLWVLDPKAFASLANSGKLTGLVAHKALRAILSLLQLRRTTATEMDVFGTVKRVGDTIPMYRITTVELGFNAAEQRQYDEVWRRLSGQLSRHDKTTGGHQKAKPQADRDGLRNMSIHRHLALTTFDVRFHQLLTRTKQTLSADIQTWHDKNADHGATLYTRLTRLDPLMPLFTDRWSLCEYMCSMSPKLRYLCRHVWESLYGPEAERGKSVVYANWPPSQWQPASLLRNLGIPCYVVRAGMDNTERRSIIEKFNKPDDPVQFLILNSRSASLGLNLQEACHRMIILDFPDNINTLLQQIGRIHRLSQKSIQRIWIVGVDHSYDQILQAKAIKKMIVQLLGESQVEETKMDITKERSLRRSLAVPDDDDEFELVKLEFLNRAAVEQVNQYLNVLLGFRVSRLDWDDKDLYAKDSLVDAGTPRRQRGKIVGPSGQNPRHSSALSVGQDTGVTPASSDTIDSPSQVPRNRPQLVLSPRRSSDPVKSHEVDPDRPHLGPQRRLHRLTTLKTRPTAAAPVHDSTSLAVSTPDSSDTVLPEVAEPPPGFDEALYANLANLVAKNLPPTDETMYQVHDETMRDTGAATHPPEDGSDMQQLPDPSLQLGYLSVEDGDGNDDVMKDVAEEQDVAEEMDVAEEKDAAEEKDVAEEMDLAVENDEEGSEEEGSEDEEAAVAAQLAG